MENSSKKIVDTINDLVQINNDRCEGYKVASQEIKDANLTLLFENYSQQSETFAGELGKEVVSLGEKPVEGTRADGKLYRIWMDVKAAMAGNNRQAVLNSCEYGEDVALRNYDAALKADVILPPNIRQAISRQKRELQGAHTHIKSLRDAFKSSERNVF